MMMMMIAQFSIKCRTTKPKRLLPPITTDQKSAMSHSEFEPITSSRRKARENESVQVAIGIDLVTVSNAILTSRQTRRK